VIRLHDRTALRTGDLFETPSGARFEIIAPGVHHYIGWTNAWVRSTETGAEYHATLYPDVPYRYWRPTP